MFFFRKVLNISCILLSSSLFQYLKIAAGSSLPPQAQGVQINDVIAEHKRKAPVWESFNLVVLTNNKQKAQCNGALLTIQGNSTLRRHIFDRLRPEHYFRSLSRDWSVGTLFLTGYGRDRLRPDRSDIWQSLM